VYAAVWQILSELGGFCRRQDKTFWLTFFLNHSVAQMLIFNWQRIHDSDGERAKIKPE